MIPSLQVLIYLLLFLLVFGLSVFALVDASLRPARAFVAADKRTKRFWLLVLAGATAVAFVALPPPLGIGQLEFLALGSAVAAGVYLGDVRPRLTGGPRRRNPRSGGW